MFNNNSTLCLEYGQLLYNNTYPKVTLIITINKVYFEDRIVAQHYWYTPDTLITVIMQWQQEELGKCEQIIESVAVKQTLICACACVCSVVLIDSAYHYHDCCQCNIHVIELYLTCNVTNTYRKGNRKDLVQLITIPSWQFHNPKQLGWSKLELQIIPTHNTHKYAHTYTYGY